MRSGQISAGLDPIIGVWLWPLKDQGHGKNAWISGYLRSFRVPGKVWWYPT